MCQKQNLSIFEVDSLKEMLSCGVIWANCYGAIWAMAHITHAQYFLLIVLLGLIDIRYGINVLSFSNFGSH